MKQNNNTNTSKITKNNSNSAIVLPYFCNYKNKKYLKKYIHL